MSNRIALISCVAKKDLTPQLTFDLYKSPWFVKVDRYTKSLNYNYRFVLSAKHGLLSEYDLIEPYEQSLIGLTSKELKKWSESVFEKINAIIFPGDVVDIYAGKAYRKYLAPLIADKGCSVNVPLIGLGIGSQLSWLDKQWKSSLSGGINPVMEEADATTSQTQ
jgi:hypothetical protein